MKEELTLPGDLLKQFFADKPIRYKHEKEIGWQMGTLDFVPLPNGKCYLSILTTKTKFVTQNELIFLTPDTIELLQYHSGQAMFYLSFQDE